MVASTSYSTRSGRIGVSHKAQGCLLPGPAHIREGVTLGSCPLAIRARAMARSCSSMGSFMGVRSSFVTLITTSRIPLQGIWRFEVSTCLRQLTLRHLWRHDLQARLARDRVELERSGAGRRSRRYLGRVIGSSRPRPCTNATNARGSNEHVLDPNSLRAAPHDGSTEFVPDHDSPRAAPR
jgi:hypothetical protein